MCDYFSVTKGQVSVIKVCLSLTNIQLLILKKFGFSLEFYNCLCFQDAQCFVLAESKCISDALSPKYGCSNLPLSVPQAFGFPCSEKKPKSGFRELIKGMYSIFTPFKVPLVQIPSHTGAMTGYEVVPKFLLFMLSVMVHHFPGN